MKFAYLLVAAVWSGIAGCVLYVTPHLRGRLLVLVVFVAFLVLLRLAYLVDMRNSE